MTRLEDRYLTWLEEHAMSQDRSYYSQLLRYLYDKPYRYSLRMDENRAEDGIELRYKFGAQQGIPYEDILTGLDSGKDCTMLEMMVGLEIRIESQIMVDMEEGEQPERWFIIMLKTLGLYDMTDEYFDEEEVDEIVERFLSHRYSYYGDGSLFYVSHPRQDMRVTDIWYQAMWYLTENYY